MDLDGSGHLPIAVHSPAHGGENSLRFTPHFGVTDDELDLLVSLVRQAIVLH